MTDRNPDAIKARAEAAAAIGDLRYTQAAGTADDGDWERMMYTSCDPYDVTVTVFSPSGRTREMGDFIAHAATDTLALLAEVEGLREQVVLEASNVSVAQQQRHEARDALRRAVAERDEVRVEVAELRDSLTALAPSDEVEVEGSIFQRAALPEVLGEFMRAADRYAQDAKDAASRVDAAEAERDALAAIIERVRRMADLVHLLPDADESDPDEYDYDAGMATGHNIAMAKIRRVLDGDGESVRAGGIELNATLRGETDD